MTEIEIPMREAGEGRPVLVLHGGGGPGTVFPLAQHLAATERVFTPTHPGFNGTPRHPGVSSVADLAGLYLEALEQRGLQDVLVVGSSVGGWIAVEMGLRAPAKRLRGLVVINGGGVDVPGEPITDISGMDFKSIAALSFHDASKLPPQPPPTPDEVAVRKGNMETLHLLAGTPHYMHDPGLLGRLGGLQLPALFVWGQSDRIFSAGYGRAYARAVPGAELAPIEHAGHLPWFEQPAATFAAIDRFVARH